MTRWSGALLVGYQDSPSDSPLISAVDRSEKYDRISLQIPGASTISVASVGGGFDGSLVAGGNVIDGNRHRAGFIAWYSSDREQQNLIRTEPFAVEAVAIDARGVIWAAGDTEDGETGKSAGSILRRYDVFGRMLSSFQLRNADGTLSGWCDMSSRLMASKDRVGWLTSRTEYVEFSLDGAIRDRFEGPSTTFPWKGIQYLLGWALSQNNDVIVQKLFMGESRTEVVALDRGKRAWVAVTLPVRTPGEGQRVLGFDGATLVLQRRDCLERLKPVEPHR